MNHYHTHAIDLILGKNRLRSRPRVLLLVTDRDMGWDHVDLGRFQGSKVFHPTNSTAKHFGLPVDIWRMQGDEKWVKNQR